MLYQIGRNIYSTNVKKVNLMSNKIVDKAIDAYDQLSNPTSRAGVTVKRVSQLVMNDVDKEVIALQLNKNSSTGNIYTPEQIQGIAQVFEDCRTRPGITKTQANALIKDQNNHHSECGSDISEPVMFLNSVQSIL